MILRFAHEVTNTIFPSRMEVITEEGEAKIIRLIEGSTKINESEQPKDAKLKEFRTGFANVKVGDDAFYQVEVTDKSIINYLKATPLWGKYIHEYNPLDESKVKSDAFKYQAQLLLNIATMKEEDLLSLGYARLGNKALEYAKAKDYEGLRLTVAADAQENPEDVAEMIDDKKNADRLMTGLAFAKGVLVEAEAGNAINWGHNNAKILTVPRNITPLEAIVDFYGEQEGREIRKMVYQKLGVKSTAATKTTAAAKETETEK